MNNTIANATAPAAKRVHTYPTASAHAPANENTKTSLTNRGQNDVTHESSQPSAPDPDWGIDTVGIHPSQLDRQHQQLRWQQRP